MLSVLADWRLMTKLELGGLHNGQVAGLLTPAKRIRKSSIVCGSVPQF